MTSIDSLFYSKLSRILHTYILLFEGSAGCLFTTSTLQGCVLGLLSFTLLTHDHMATYSTNQIKFADDTSLTVTRPTTGATSLANASFTQQDVEADFALIFLFDK